MPHQSVLDVLESSLGELPRVVLNETEDQAQSGDPRDGPPDSISEAFGRYRLQSQIGRGGMGDVFRGRDTDLGRELALKVLREDHRGHPELARRFVEEAQIGGQLVHPGIAPIYDFGRSADGRPFFTMKLVKGRTLHELLAARRTAAEDLPRYLAIFEQVCQTMAYAHARGVIHRDLKPNNIMVGSFGEVQVMDWGLAKVLPRSEASGGKAATESAVSAIRTVRSSSPANATQAGSVLGTPAYMSPEQANGDIQTTDERADVFGLGSILCKILTGHPAYTGSTGQAILRKAMRGDTVDALERLENLGADEELCELTRRCLSIDRQQRPRHAGEVADAVTDYSRGVRERLRRAEEERVDAEARAREEAKRRALADQLALEARARATSERRRRRVTVGLAASVLALAGLAGDTWLLRQQSRVRRHAAVVQALGEARRLQVAAYSADADEAARLAEAVAAVERAEGLLAQGGDTRQKHEARALMNSLAADREALRKESEWLGRLIEIRSTKVESADGFAAETGYAAVFREAEIDPDSSSTEAAERIQARKPAVAQALVAALDDWAAVRRTQKKDVGAARQLTEVARLADPNPWRGRLRAALDQPRGKDRLVTLRAIADSARVEDMPAVSLDLLGVSLLDEGDAQAAADLLLKAQRAHPSDGWLKYNLARSLDKLGRTEEAIRYLMAARTIHPETAHDLAHALERMGEADEAIVMFRDLIRLRGTEERNLVCLAGVLQNQGVLAEAVTQLREAIRLKPDNARAHNNLGFALKCQGKLDDAMLEYRAAIRIEPDDAKAHINLGLLLFVDKHEYAAAAAEYREAIRIKPDDAESHNDLGLALRGQGRLDDAITEYRASISIKPDDARTHNNLGGALGDIGKREEAIAEYRTAIRLKSDYAEPHNNLGWALCYLGKREEAFAEYREAIRLKPDYADAHINLGVVLSDQGKREEAIAEYREAIRIKPDDVKAHNNLGLALHAQGKRDEAIAEYRTAIRIKPDDALAHYNLGVTLHSLKKWDEAIAENRAAIRSNPDHAEAHCNLGIVLFVQGKVEEAIAELSEAIRLKPDLANAHDNMGDALRKQGKPDAAIAAYRTAIQIKPDYVDAHYSLGVLLCDDKHEYAAAAAEFREAIRLKPGYADAHCSLGIALNGQGKREEAIAAYRAAIRHEPDHANAHYNLGLALSAQGKSEEAIAEYRAVIRIKPDHAEAHYDLGNALSGQGKLEEAKAAYRAAIRFRPDYAEAHCNLGSVLRSQRDYSGSLAMYRKGHELGSRRRDWNYPSARWVAEAERLAALAERWPAVLKGDDRPRDSAEFLFFADFAHDRKHFATAARIWSQALAADPMLGADHAYYAARAAALAAASKGSDDPPPNDEAKARFRAQALDWFRAELDAWSRVLDKGPAKDRSSVTRKLEYWKADPDLAGFRDSEALAKLPDREKQTWTAIWANVDALLRKAQAKGGGH